MDFSSRPNASSSVVAKCSNMLRAIFSTFLSLPELSICLYRTETIPLFSNSSASLEDELEEM